MWIEPEYASVERCASAATIRLHRALEPLQARRPEIRQELLERLEALRIDRVNTSLTFPAHVDEAGSGQHLEVLRHRLLCDLEMAPDLAGRARPSAHELEDVAPAWLDERGEDRLGSHH